MRDGLLYRGGMKYHPKFQIIKLKEGIHTKMSCFTPNKKTFDQLNSPRK